jgi:RNA polymerase sigma-54 factor
MILKDVAERIGMDISTISRVVNGKYVQTEWGVYELKYYFSEGLTTDSGEEVSNKEVKAIIERIIADEDKEKPPLVTRRSPRCSRRAGSRSPAAR